MNGIGARISIADERFILINRQSHDQNDGPVVHYFHRPLFILKKNENPISGFPSIVKRVVARADTRTFLLFDVILSTAQFREDAKAFVIENDPGLRLPGVSLDTNSIVVDPWPIVTLQVKVTDSINGDILGTWLSPSLEAAGDNLTVPIGFESEQLQTFEDLVKTGDISFNFSYTYRNVRQQYAASLATASRQITQALQNAVTSSNISPGNDIFQDQADKFRSQLSTELATVVSATEADLIPSVQSQLIDRYLSQQTVNIADINDKAVAEQIAGYIKPLLKTYADKRSQEISHGTSQEDGDTIKLGGAADGATFGIDHSDKNTMTSKYGVTFEQSATDQSYEPSKISVYRLSDISDNATVQIVSRAFVEQGGDPSFFEDTPVGSDFTDDKVGSYKKDEKISSYDGILPGMAFCYFGDTIPHGFVELDGSSKWPDAAYLPESLRGKVTPDSQNLLLGLTRGADVGTVWSSGKINVGQIRVPGNALRINFQLYPATAVLSVDHFGLSDREANRKLSAGIPDAMGDIWAFTRDIHVSSVDGQIQGPSIGIDRTMAPPNLRCRLIMRE